MRAMSKVFFTFCLSMMTLVAVAQTSFGLRMGSTWSNVNTSTAIGNATPNFKNINGFSIGVFAEIPVAPQFSIQPEIGFTRKGFVVAEGFDAPLFGVDLPIGVTAETKFDYLEIPVLAKYSFGEDKLKAYVAIGPNIGYALNGRVDTKTNLLVDINLGSTNINLQDQDFNRIEIGATGAVGASYDAGFGTLFVDARYNRGFTEVYNLPFVDEKVKTSGFGLNVGFAVPIN